MRPRGVLEPLGLTAEEPDGTRARDRWEALTRAGRAGRRRSGAASAAASCPGCWPSCACAPTRGTPRWSRASRWRRCTPPRDWSGMRCSWSGWPTARCPSRTRWRTAPTASPSKKSVGCSTSESPGPECIWRSAGRWPAAPGGRQSRKPSRFLNGIAPQTRVKIRRRASPVATGAPDPLPDLQQQT